MKTLYRSVLIITLVVTLSAAQYDLTHEDLQKLLSERAPVGGSRVVGGQNAVDGQFPHQLLLLSFRFITDTQSSGFCGGSLIAAQWSLTAAHCLVTGPLNTLLGKFVVLGGSANQYTLGPNYQYQTVLALGNAIIHSQYNPSTIVYDIGLLKLAYPFSISGYIYPIALPANTFNDQLFVGQNVTIAGWGYTQTGGLVSPAILQWTTLQILSDADCTARTSPNYPKPTSFCVQGTTSPPFTSPCQGDSGGAAIIKIGCETFQIGIASYTINACDLGYPTGYVIVAQFRQWIADNAGI